MFHVGPVDVTPEPANGEVVGMEAKRPFKGGERKEERDEREGGGDDPRVSGPA